MKRLLTILIAIILVVSSVTGAYAASIDNPTLGTTIFTDSNWAYVKVNLYGYEISSYLGDATKVSLPYSFSKEYITSIGEYSFSEKANITEINLTPFVESVKEYAFYNCSGLNKITLYEAIKTIEVGAFYGTAALRDVNLQDTSIESVSAYCFTDSGIEELELPETCLSIGSMAFYNCTNLMSLSIPSSVTEIADNAFSGCDNLVIYAENGSYAIEYAKAHDIDYVVAGAVEVTFKLGDADGDDLVTILDATKIQRVLVDLDTDADGMIALRGHVTYDSAEDSGELNIMDATRIQRWLADYTVPVEIGSTVTKFINPTE